MSANVYRVKPKRLSRFWIVCLIAIGVIGSLSLVSYLVQPSPAIQADTVAVPASTAAETAAPPQKSVLPEEQNAVRAAKGYLSTQAFSRKALIKQLSSQYGDGYPVKVATAAVDSMRIDWNQQAALAAKEYLTSQAFSRNGLIKQLESPYGGGFTHTQAVYGVDHSGL